MTTKERAFACPACRTVGMKKYGDSQVGLVIDSCPDCKGLWFDGGELRRFFKSDALISHRGRGRPIYVLHLFARKLGPPLPALP